MHGRVSPSVLDDSKVGQHFGVAGSRIIAETFFVARLLYRHLDRIDDYAPNRISWQLDAQMITKRIQRSLDRAHQVKHACGVSLQSVAANRLRDVFVRRLKG